MLLVPKGEKTRRSVSDDVGVKVVVEGVSSVRWRARPEGNGSLL